MINMDLIQAKGLGAAQNAVCILWMMIYITVIFLKEWLGTVINAELF